MRRARRKDGLRGLKTGQGKGMLWPFAFSVKGRTGMIPRRIPAAVVLALLALAALGCRGRRDAGAIARDLAATAEEMADVLSGCENPEDLKAREPLLADLARRITRLSAEARRAKRSLAGVPAEDAARLDAALKRIVERRGDWLAAGKQDMVDFTDALAGR
jgi:hypothetical protein